MNQRRASSRSPNQRPTAFQSDRWQLPLDHAHPRLPGYLPQRSSSCPEREHVRCLPRHANAPKYVPRLYWKLELHVNCLVAAKRNRSREQAGTASMYRERLIFFACAFYCRAKATRTVIATQSTQKHHTLFAKEHLVAGAGCDNAMALKQPKSKAKRARVWDFMWRAARPQVATHNPLQANTANGNGET